MIESRKSKVSAPINTFSLSLKGTHLSGSQKTFCQITHRLHILPRFREETGNKAKIPFQQNQISAPRTIIFLVPDA